MSEIVTVPPPFFDTVETWIFDLDNTLYPASSRLFDDVSRRMTAFISEYFNMAPDAAYQRQRDFFMRYGTTLRGLMVEHRMDPEPFLTYVHAIDIGVIQAAPELAERLALLPGRKLIFTNSSRQHAQRVLDRLGITAHFEEIFDIAAADYVPKPDKTSYSLMLQRHQVTPQSACMIDDIARNLEPAKALGMKTVWLRGGIDWARHQNVLGVDYVDHTVDDLVGWLDDVIRRRNMLDDWR